MSVNIRNATLADREFVKLCMSDLLRISMKSDKLPKVIGFDKTFDRMLQNPETSPVFIAESDGNPLGVAACSITDSLEMGCSVLLINELVVRPQSRNKGVGTALINHCKKYSEEKGMGAIELMQPSNGTEGDTERRTFYERNGFWTLGPSSFFLVDHHLIE